MYTEQEKQSLAKKYLPLVIKISRDIWNTLDRKVDFDELKGYAYLGLALAFEKFDTSRSNLTFQQYAAWSIRNSILNGVTECSRTVVMSYYFQQKLKEQDQSTINTFRIEYNAEGETVNVDRNAILSEAPESFSLINPLNEMKRVLEKNFSKEMCDIFFSSFGLFGHEHKRGKDLAEQYGVSGATITMRVKQMVNFIKEDKNLKELLSELL